jgi:hypothetical protein
MPPLHVPAPLASRQGQGATGHDKQHNAAPTLDLPLREPANLRLIGSLEANISLLTFLKTLDVSHNKLTGEVGWAACTCTLLQC